MEPAQGEREGDAGEGSVDDDGGGGGGTESRQVRRVARYHTQPADGVVVDDKVAVLLYTDAFGLSMPNPKIQADAFAEHLKLHVFVPEYIPEPPPAELFEPVAPIYPEQYANRSWFTTIRMFFGVITKVYPWLPMLLMPKKQVPLAQAALEDLVQEGYTTLGAIGYCRGGAMVEYLFSNPANNTSLRCGVMCHPSPERATYEGIEKPSLWHLADHDQMFGQKEIDHLKEVFDKKKVEKGVEFECVVHPDTVHGFAARPTLDHEPTKKAFEEANSSAIAFFRKHLLSGV
ncbi:hypothetical protein I316_01058 [Kwoniella heveanensis BCC8398]|uniref:Dienelactone hydrolase domain-containing protein n=1 Tax=Kwoniella heveanensis BCC8398 TaxID=1296120 RepID=A0A1B9H1K2_9TREE|nr:hypothetical protein I316_01058 [Kwoniella heveanensis BCC8398]